MARAAPSVAPVSEKVSLQRISCDETNYGRQEALQIYVDGVLRLTGDLRIRRECRAENCDRQEHRLRASTVL